jgi:hypothetical protein
MILAIELVLLITGVYALFAGKLLAFGAARKYDVLGWPARVIGVISLLPIPLSVGAVFVASSQMAAEGKDITSQSYFWLRTAIEGAIVLVCAAAIVAIRLKYQTPIEAQQNGRGLAVHDPADVEPSLSELPPD